ncbi:uncharacterized protein [Anoplolepis gracilipes]|uniref:uncharacterized protein n=1 Tax=Anoplolepis gracilipes TaxID=354296 RepID=UPI003BA000DB
MSSTIRFCLVMSTLTATKGTTDAYRIAVESYSSSSTESENLKIILNYVRSEQEFHPSIFSLVSSDIRSNFVDLVSKYVATESIVSYKITMNDLSQRYTWQNRVDLTWIFIVDDIDVLKFFVREQGIWKATNQYLVIVTSPTLSVSSRDIFQTVWKTYNVYRIILVSIQDDFRCLSRYLPFEKNRQNEYGVVSKVCLTNRPNNIKLYTNFENLNGYPIRVIVFRSLMMNVTFDEDTRTYEYKGLDADAMFLLEKSLGAQFCIDVVSINFTKGRRQDPFHHSLQHIEDDESEVIITSFFIYQYQEYQRYEFTTSISEDKLCLIAPSADFIPKSYMPIMPFAPDLWTALAIYNVLVSVLWFLIKYYSGSFRRQEAVLLPLTRTEFILSRRSNLPPRIHPYVTACFNLVETSCYPLKEDDGGQGSTTAQRVFLFGTLFFGLIVVGLYQSYLVSGLSNPFHYPELNTLEDVANSNLTLVTKYYNLKEHTFTENTTLDNKLHSKIKIIVSDKPINDFVAFGKKVVAIARYASIKLGDLSNYYDADGNELLHLVEECPTTYSLSYIMRLYSPYRERINELLLRMKEAGLINLWYENMAYPIYVNEQKRKVDKSERRIKLTMEHYSLTFVGLLIGLLFCIIIFFAELYFAKKSQSNITEEKGSYLISKN